jgi:hypothetical protein
MIAVCGLCGSLVHPLEGCTVRPGRRVIELPAGPVKAQGWVRAPRKVSMAQPWRGENDGRAGERFTARLPQWGTR